MKTAISVPDETFGQATRCAQALGMNRSEFITAAIEHYMRQLETDELTSRVDAAIDLIGDDDSGQVAADYGHRFLDDGAEW